MASCHVSTRQRATVCNNAFRCSSPACAVSKDAGPGLWASVISARTRVDHVKALARAARNWRQAVIEVWIAQLSSLFRLLDCRLRVKTERLATEQHCENQIGGAPKYLHVGCMEQTPPPRADHSSVRLLCLTQMLICHWAWTAWRGQDSGLPALNRDLGLLKSDETDSPPRGRELTTKSRTVMNSAPVSVLRTPY